MSEKLEATARHGAARPHGGAWARIALGAAALVALAACGSSGPSGSSAVPGSAAAQAHPAGPHPAAGKAAHAAALGAAGKAHKVDADMVAAVGNGRASVPVQVRFALRQRPEVGKPVELDVELTPSAPVDRIITSFHADDGLTLRDGAAAQQTDRPELGVPLSRALTIVARRDGIFYVDANVVADAGPDSSSRTFTIPIIAGAGTP
jgi:hypothetical protein